MNELLGMIVLFSIGIPIIFILVTKVIYYKCEKDSLNFANLIFRYPLTFLYGRKVKCPHCNRYIPQKLFKVCPVCGNNLEGVPADTLMQQIKTTKIRDVIFGTILGLAVVIILFLIIIFATGQFKEFTKIWTE